MVVLVSGVALSGAVVAAAVASQVWAADVHAVPTADLNLDLSSGSTLAPVMGEDGNTMVGPDGRERCVAIGPPPPVLAAAPGSTAVDPGAYQAVQGGVETALVDRPLTLAETVPCR